MGVLDHFTCLLRSLYVSQEETGLGTTDWFKIGKGVHQGCILSPCLFNLKAEYIMWNAEVDESQAGIKIQFSSVQSLSRVRLFATPWIAAHQASLSITNSRSSPKLMSIESVMPSSHLILCHPLLLPPIPPSITVFSSESTLRMKWPKYWSFSFSIIPSKEHPGLVGSPCSPRDSQESSPTHSSKASILRCSAFFTVQLSHPYMTAGKTIALTRQTLLAK